MIERMKFANKTVAIDFGITKLKEGWIVHVRPLTFGDIRGSENRFVRDSWEVAWWCQ